MADHDIGKPCGAQGCPRYGVFNASELVGFTCGLCEEHARALARAIRDGETRVRKDMADLVGAPSTLPPPPRMPAETAEVLMQDRERWRRRAILLSREVEELKAKLGLN